jgi:hypothetical protein
LIAFRVKISQIIVTRRQALKMYSRRNAPCVDGKRQKGAIEILRQNLDGIYLIS